MENQDIRHEIAKARLRFYEVAEQLGINESSFSRKLRYELKESEKAKIRKAIREIEEREGVYYAENPHNQAGV